MRINLFQADKRLKEPVGGFGLTFKGLQIAGASERRSTLQAIVNYLVRSGVDSCVALPGAASAADVYIAMPDKAFIDRTLARYERLNPQLAPMQTLDGYFLEDMWQNRIRIELQKRGFFSIGDRYVKKEDIIDRSTKYKPAIRIQARIVNSTPSLYIDPRTRIMIPLTAADVKRADELKEGSDIKVMVLPRWQRGLLVGTSGCCAEDKEFTLGDKALKAPDYWRASHGIDFVSPKDKMVEVYLDGIGKALSYPSSCVFRAFERGESLDPGLKRYPDHRVRDSQEFLKNYLSSVRFSGQDFNFFSASPVRPADIGFLEHKFPPASQLLVSIGQGLKKVPTTQLRGAISGYGPYAGQLNGKLLVLYSGDDSKTKKTVDELRKVYAEMKLGNLGLYHSIGAGGYVKVGGESVADYTSAIYGIRSALDEVKEPLLALIILPPGIASSIYYRSREKLFEALFGYKPLPGQAIKAETVDMIAGGGKSAYPSVINTAAQIYVKMGGTGYALWILDTPADVNIADVKPGSSCYAFHDVSRRPSMKASAMAYSAMTDSWGRYIATGTKPVGGETLTPSVFWDVLIDMIQKVSLFNRRYRHVGESREWELKRLVFAKDGVIKPAEAEMMLNVVSNGIPKEGREPISTVLTKNPSLPHSLIIDIISVNKSPNKRLFGELGGKYTQVPEGTAISFDANTGLLVSCDTRFGTQQPLEIAFHSRILLNMGGTQTPTMSQILEEYYRLTFLDWASIFKQGKYALPQILTQNLGENISAGVTVPDNMIVI